MYETMQILSEVTKILYAFQYLFDLCLKTVSFLRMPSEYVIYIINRNNMILKIITCKYRIF